MALCIATVYQDCRLSRHPEQEIMRCPKCEERNSVAARKCEYCGERFKKKTTPAGLKLAAGGLAIAATVSLLASYVVPKLIDPEQNLVRNARRIATGPKSPEDAKQIRKEFVDAVKSYLKQTGNAKPQELHCALEKSLSSTAFEVHVVELPRNLKLVEIDMLLQATGFLVMNTQAGIKVFELPEFEVFDDARILNDSAGPVLALIGHTGGPPPHRPLVRTYALLPDYINDETEKLVPVCSGEGTAKFDKNGQDIRLDLSLHSVAKADNIAFDTTTRDETVHEYLRWKDARYTQSADLVNSAGGIAYSVAKSLHHPNIVNSIDADGSVKNFIKTNPQKPGDQLILANMGVHKGRVSYRLGVAGKQFILSMQKNGSRYNANEIRLAEKNEIARMIPAGSVVSPNNAAFAVAPSTVAAPVASTPAAPPVSATRPTTSSASEGTSAAQPVVAQAVSKPVAPAPAVPVSKRTADRKIVVRGLTDEGTKLAATMPADSGAALAAPAILAAPKTTMANIAATAQSVTEKLSGKHSGKNSHAQSTETEHEEKTSGRSGIVSGAYGATLRASGSTGAKALNSISKGDSLDIISKSGDWYHVRYQGREGYVFASLVSASEIKSAASSSPSSSSSRRHGRRERDRVPVVAAATESRSSSREHGRHRRGHGSSSSSNEEHKVASSVPMPEPAAGKRSRSEEKHKVSSSNSGNSSKPAHNKVKMAAVEPLLVP